MSAFEGEEFIVLYGWEPENDGDLRLVAGDTILVTEKNDHGWWNGIIERDGTPHTGYFPKNYVRVKSAVNALPKPPPRPLPKINDGAENMEKLEETFQETKIQYNSRKSVAKQGPSFSLKTLEAFDELMEFGVAVEIEPISPAPTGAYIANGMRVELKISALLWDGASSVIEEFGSGNLSFTVGCGQVTKGLNTAVLRLRVNDSATITCSPSNAYGEAGNPPSVPPDSFIVYRVQVLSAIAPSGGGALIIPVAVGPSSILGAGIATSRYSASVGNATPFTGEKDSLKEKRSSRMMLVYNDSTKATASSSGDNQATTSTEKNADGSNSWEEA